ncbi:O-antigen ligase family protein [Teichococcus oryzae]|uniref:O-antigen ligase family protein n=1 Tax=Teichococcus oryzae TaxID=1608942 RepID=A0A5B2TLE8_9PROT|nr:O-antigen ligase family protein [Pseudoroseomonas oryzae]KAA2215014.1 O-antigen ligase family protein [Pseudoroseomonas oryzae]
MPLCAAALLAPPLAVLQSKAMAPLALLALLATVLLARRAQGRWPWPSAPAFWAGLALAAWGCLSALWAIEPGRALSNGLSLGGLVLLAGAAARAAMEDLGAARRQLGFAILAGLAIGLAAALFDHLTGSTLRAAVRGLDQIPPSLAFGLKPAASVMALLLPLLAGIALPPAARALLLVAGCVLLLFIPGDTARLAALAGIVAVALVAAEQRWRRQSAPRLPVVLGAALGTAMLLTPLMLGPAMQAMAPMVERLPPSAIHRLAIWDFGLEKAAEHPLLGWGMESARALPGGKDRPEPERLAELGVHSAAVRAWFEAPHLELMPLHPHNGPLQIRLELGWIGSGLAALAFLALGCSAARSAAPAAASGVLASAFVTFFASFGTWQIWWLCSAAMALAFAAALRRTMPGR